jgi:hypothetical protein
VTAAWLVLVAHGAALKEFCKGFIFILRLFAMNSQLSFFKLEAFPPAYAS